MNTAKELPDSPKDKLTVADAPGWYECRYKQMNIVCVRWWTGADLSDREGDGMHYHLDDWGNFRGPLVVATAPLSDAERPENWQTHERALRFKIDELRHDLAEQRTAAESRIAELEGELAATKETRDEERERIRKIKRATCEGCLAAAMGLPLHTVAESGYAARSYCGDAWEQGWEFMNGSATWQSLSESRKECERLRQVLREMLQVFPIAKPEYAEQPKWIKGLRERIDAALATEKAG
jgi:hypothetical protein